MASGLFTGALAGAAGTTALNGVTYLDMAIRGRDSSDTPQQVVERLSQRTGVDVPGKGGERDNRVEGLAPLLGSLVGVSVGALAGRLDRALVKRGKKLPAWIGVPLITAAAMAASDVPLKVLGISDPTSWTKQDWLSDVVPHLAYGIVTHATIAAARS